MIRTICSALAFVTASVLSAAALEKSVADSVTKAVYEVVLPKPTNDTLSYERPLPFDLLPYRERTDPYYSVGTAFAIGSNSFISAAHVFDIAMGLGYDLHLRDAQGAILIITSVIRYSKQRDLVQFSCNAEARAVLTVNKEPLLNSTVYTVGNALGEGVVIRDGTLTSFTPEDERNAWKWIRFTSPASPGNSGGPLIDATGAVVGIVLMKSQNENLNYALPISEVLRVPKNTAEYRKRFDYVFPCTSRKNIGFCDFTVPLPLDSAGLYAAVIANVKGYCDSLRLSIMQSNRDSLFPSGKGSGKLLNDRAFLSFPSLPMEGNDGVWKTNRMVVSEPVDMGSSGTVRIGIQGQYVAVRIRRPTSMHFSEFITNGRMQMDSILKALPLSRTVAGDKVRITSYGSPVRESLHTDRYGRVWIFRAWWLAYQNTYAITYTLPLPDGTASLFKLRIAFAVRYVHRT